MNERVLTLYERPGCALCEHMALAVQRDFGNSKARLNRVNIDTQPALKAKFDWEVPLLFGGDTEICRHRLDAQALRNWLALSE